jgi:hypothetical protein
MNEDEALSQLRESSEKPALQSKKWTMALIGLVSVMATYGTGITVCVMKPEIAPHVVSLSTMVITFLGSLVGAYTIGQSFVDWRTQASVATVAQTSREDVNIHQELIRRTIDVSSRAKEEDYSLEIADPSGAIGADTDGP